MLVDVKASQEHPSSWYMIQLCLRFGCGKKDVCRVCWSEESIIEVKVDSAVRDDTTWSGRPLATAFHWVIKERSHPLIFILNYENFPTIKLFQTTSYNLVMSSSSSSGQLAAIWTTRRGEPGSSLTALCSLGFVFHTSVFSNHYLLLVSANT